MDDTKLHDPQRLTISEWMGSTSGPAPMPAGMPMSYPEPQPVVVMGVIEIRYNSADPRPEYVPGDANHYVIIYVGSKQCEYPIINVVREPRVVYDFFDDHEPKQNPHNPWATKDDR